MSGDYWDRNAFAPIGLTTSGTCTSASVAFQLPNAGTPGGSSPSGFGPNQGPGLKWRAYPKNLGGATEVFIAYGTGSNVTATTTSGMPLAVGQVTLQRAPVNQTWVGMIASAGTVALYATAGDGDVMS